MAKKRPTKTTIAVVSDVHAGSTVAVCPPTVPLDDGGSFTSSKVQRWLWNGWLSYWATVNERSHGGSLYTVFNGDLTEGNHHGTTQIASGNPVVQSHIVDSLLELPLALKPDKMFFIRGTAAHVGKSASNEESVALRLAKAGYPVQRCEDMNTASWWKLEMEEQGKLLTFSHHGRIGQRPWTKVNNVILLAKQIFMEHAEKGWRHPDLAVRSHYHTLVDTYDAAPTRVIQTPAWQIHTEHAWKVVPESISDVGGLIITIEDGRLDVEKFIIEPIKGAVWRSK